MAFDENKYAQPIVRVHQEGDVVIGVEVWRDGQWEEAWWQSIQHDGLYTDLSVSEQLNNEGSLA